MGAIMFTSLDAKQMFHSDYLTQWECYRHPYPFIIHDVILTIYFPTRYPCAHIKLPLSCAVTIIPYSGKVWRGESLANLANRP